MIGQEVPVFVQIPPLGLPLEPEYQRRVLGLNLRTSVPWALAQKFKTVPSARFNNSSPLETPLTQDTSIVFVTGSMSLPCGPQSVRPRMVFTIAPVPDGPAVGSMTTIPAAGTV